MARKWESNINCIQFIDNTVRTYDCPDQSKRGDCSNCEYFRGVKHDEDRDFNSLKGCCALLFS